VSSWVRCEDTSCSPTDISRSLHFKPKRPTGRSLLPVCSNGKTNLSQGLYELLEGANALPMPGPSLLLYN
jgi:hypothetical protein